MDAEQLGRIIPLIYEASFDDDLWPVVANEMSRLFADAAIVIDDNATAGLEFGHAASALFDTSLKLVHFDAYTTPDANPGVAALFRTPVGRSVSIASFLDKKAFDADPSCRAILQPQAIDKGLIVPFHRDGPGLGYMNVLRRKRQADFNDEEARGFEMLAAHIARACEIRRCMLARRLRTETRRQRMHAARAVEGMLLIGQDGRVIDVDASLEPLLDASKGLHVRAGRLVSTSTRAGENTEALRRFIADDLPSRRPFVLRLDDGSVTILESFPAFDRIAAGSPGRCRVVTVRQLSPKVEPDIRAFAAAYGLTPMEQRVVAALTRSASATQAAEHLGISRETMKSHLRRIYARTATQSLPTLLLLVGRFA
ncbi:MAG: hypothetical protein R3D31_10105 [Hyphomicrobiaceae bacterium]